MIHKTNSGTTKYIRWASKIALSLSVHIKLFDTNMYVCIAANIQIHIFKGQGVCTNRTHIALFNSINVAGYGALLLAWLTFHPSMDM